jgi:hypothetical protein
MTDAVTSYVDEVMNHLRVARHRRRAIRADLVAELAELPEANDRTALEQRIGSPGLYAREIAEAVDARPIRPWFRRAAVGALVALLLVGWLVWSAAANPVRQGSALGFRELTVAHSQDDFGDGVAIAYEPGAEGRVVFTLANRGLLPVTLLDVRLFPPFRDGSGEGSLILQDDVMAGRSGEVFGLLEHAAPVVDDHPRISAGEEIELMALVRFDNCEDYAPDTGIRFESVEVTYRYLGISHTKIVSFTPIAVEAPAVCTP